MGWRLRSKAHAQTGKAHDREEMHCDVGRRINPAIIGTAAKAGWEHSFPTSPGRDGMPTRTAGPSAPKFGHADCQGRCEASTPDSGVSNECSAVSPGGDSGTNHEITKPTAMIPDATRKVCDIALANAPST